MCMLVDVRKHVHGVFIGIRIFCTEERSQGKNRERAMSLLRSKLYDLEQEKQRSEIQAQRKSQVLYNLQLPNNCVLVVTKPTQLSSYLVLHILCRMLLMLQRMPSPYGQQQAEPVDCTFGSIQYCYCTHTNTARHCAGGNRCKVREDKDIQL